MNDTQFEGLESALRGRYTLVRRLGRGGMGAVYLGRDVKLGRQVAIKALLPEIRGAMGDERFKLEVLLVSRLSHPHIVPLFEADDVNGIAFLRDGVRVGRVLTTAPGARWSA